MQHNTDIKVVKYFVLYQEEFCIETDRYKVCFTIPKLELWGEKNVLSKNSISKCKKQ